MYVRTGQPGRWMEKHQLQRAEGNDKQNALNQSLDITAELSERPERFKATLEYQL